MADGHWIRMNDDDGLGQQCQITGPPNARARVPPPSPRARVPLPPPSPCARALQPPLHLELVRRRVTPSLPPPRLEFTSRRRASSFPHLVWPHCPQQPRGCSSTQSSQPLRQGRPRRPGGRLVILIIVLITISHLVALLVRPDDLKCLNTSR
jgi:hypothetical protein